MPQAGGIGGHGRPGPRAAAPAARLAGAGRVEQRGRAGKRAKCFYLAFCLHKFPF